MGFLKSVSKFASHIVDIRVDRWFNLEGHQNNISYITKLTRRLFKSQTLENPEALGSFEKIVSRDALTPDWLNQQSQHYKKLSLLFVGLALMLFIYAMVLLYLRNFMGLCISMALVIYALSLAFRFHFFHFQIMKRRLDCTPKEWAHFIKTEARRSMTSKGISDV